MPEIPLDYTLEDFLENKVPSYATKSFLYDYFDRCLENDNPYINRKEGFVQLGLVGLREKNQLFAEVWKYAKLIKLKRTISKKIEFYFGLDYASNDKYPILLETLNFKLKELKQKESEVFRILEENKTLKIKLDNLKSNIAKKRISIFQKNKSLSVRKDKIHSLKRDLVDIKEGKKKWVKMDYKYVLVNNKR